MSVTEGTTLVPWLISAVYFIATYEKHILNQTRPTYYAKNNKRLYNTTPSYLTLFGLLHQKGMDVVEGTFHGTKVVNFHEWRFYKK